jgi:hypothetical protein
VNYTPERLAACNVLSASRSTGETLREVGKVAAGVGLGVTAIGTATAQPEITATGVVVTVLGGVSYVGGAALKGLSGVALKQFCPVIF